MPNVFSNTPNPFDVEESCFSFEKKNDFFSFEKDVFLHSKGFHNVAEHVWHTL